ncbi:MAG: sulfate ABC transporter substrate-binding protein [Gaiellales bacterium]
MSILKVPSAWLGLLSAILLVATGCGGSNASAGGAPSVKLNLVAYSTPEEVYGQIIPAFQKTAAGQNVTFSQSYGSSGDQSRAVAAGQPADIVHFALEPDIQREVDAGLVDANWNANQYHGIVADSVTVFVVRKGNPKNIHTWADLIKPGVQVITPNPFTSGGARWNVMAAYGAELKLGKTPAEAVQYLTDLFHNVPVQDNSARDALQTFTGGKGDVLLSYENEAILAQAKGAGVDYLVPDQTILIQTAAAVTKNSSHPAQAKAFLNFLWSKQAQQLFADNGYRPVVPGITSSKYQFPTPSQLFTIDDLGGWSTIKDKFFDPTKGIMAKIEQSMGVSTGG